MPANKKYGIRIWTSYATLCYNTNRPQKCGGRVNALRGFNKRIARQIAECIAWLRRIAKYIIMHIVIGAAIENRIYAGSV